MVNIKGIVNSALSNTDKLGLIYGVIADPIGGGRGLEGAPNFMIDRLSKWHIPSDLATYVHYLKNDPGYAGPLKTALMAYLAGVGLDMLGQKRYGKAAKDGAVGIAKGVGLAALLWLPAVNPHGSVEQNFEAAKQVSAYSY